VPTIVFHGDADRTVNPVSSDYVIAQARQEAALTKMVTHGETAAGMAYTRTIQLDAAGAEVFECGPCLVWRQCSRLLHVRARTRRQPGDDPLLPGACECKGGDQALIHVNVGASGDEKSQEGGSSTGALCIAV
jgi:hypothetical protein